MESAVSSPAATGPLLSRTPRQLARRFPFGYESHYVLWKLRLDPVYRETLRALHGHDLPLLDLGCGPGLLALYLRAGGFRAPVRGLDYDPRKIAIARGVAAGEPGLDFEVADLKEGLPPHCGHVTVLDILQFFNAGERHALLAAAAARVASGGRLIIRTCLRDEGWRFRLTRAGDWLAKVTWWMKDDATHYPTRDEIVDTLEAAGLRGSVRRLSGRLPFNNFFIDFARPAMEGSGNGAAAAHQQTAHAAQHEAE